MSTTVTDNGAYLMAKRREPTAEAYGPYGAVTVDFGRKLEKAIADKGWNQAELARAASKFLAGEKEFRRDSISLYVRGMQFPGPTRLRALCKALGVHESDLVQEALAATQDTPPIGMKTMTNGNVFLQINQEVPMNLALKIAGMLETAGKKRDAK